MSYEAYFKKKQELAKKKNAQAKKRGPQSVWLAFIACVLAAGSGWYLYVGDERAERIFSSIEVNFFSQANSAQDIKAEEKTTPEKGPDAAVTKKSWTDEEVALFSKLESKKMQLEAKEVELVKLEEELQKQKLELEKRLSELESIRGKISAKLDEKIKVDQQKVDSLVSVYANMKPAQAAKVLESINEELAVEVLLKMKNKSAAEILNLMNAEKAKLISEKFAGYNNNKGQDL
ncbi:MAG: hypothetical protein IPM57_00205 [Oligoflexia bacterium]|nr:hypothetical protein [Oligoflexia bacterium]